MSITKITIEYDDKERVANISINGRPATEWIAAKLELTKEVTEGFVRDGYIDRSITGPISLQLDGIIPSLVSA